MGGGRDFSLRNDRCPGEFQGARNDVRAGLAVQVDLNGAAGDLVAGAVDDGELDRVATVCPAIEIGTAKQTIDDLVADHLPNERCPLIAGLRAIDFQLIKGKTVTRSCAQEGDRAENCAAVGRLADVDQR